MRGRWLATQWPRFVADDALVANSISATCRHNIAEPAKACRSNLWIATPADIAASRIDVREWLQTLPRRSRRLAERLATGESTSGAAQMFGISPSRVSQLRRELYGAWNTFQGEST